MGPWARLPDPPRRSPEGRPGTETARLPGRFQPRPEEPSLEKHGSFYSPEQAARLREIHAKLIEARRELDALIGDAYLRPRANIVPVHFLDLAAAVEKLRWAEKEWRELEREPADEDHPLAEPDEGLVEVLGQATSVR